MSFAVALVYPAGGASTVTLYAAAMAACAPLASGARIGAVPAAESSHAASASAPAEHITQATCAGRRQLKRSPMSPPLPVRRADAAAARPCRRLSTFPLLNSEALPALSIPAEGGSA